MRTVVQFFLLFLPWCCRRFLLCRLFGYKIDPSARIGLSLIFPTYLELGKKAKIGHLTLCRRIDALILRDDSGMGSLNFITGFSSSNKEHFTHVEGRQCELVLNKGVGMTGRKYIDCTGGIYIGEFSTIAGLWTQILTHSIDVYQSRQHAAPVHIGKYCFVGTGSILLPGASLPDYSILGAGSVLNKNYSEGGILYAGVPAVPKKKLNPQNIPWMHRTTLGVK